MIFLYMMPFSFVKSQKITTSTQREFHIRIVRLKNVFCLLGIMPSTGQSTTYWRASRERRMLLRNTWFTCFTRAKLVLIAMELCSNESIVLDTLRCINVQLRSPVCAVEKSQNRHWGTNLHMRVVFHFLSDVSGVNVKIRRSCPVLRQWKLCRFQRTSHSQTSEFLLCTYAIHRFRWWNLISAVMFVYYRIHQLI